MFSGERGFGLSEFIHQGLRLISTNRGIDGAPNVQPKLGGDSRRWITHAIAKAELDRGSCGKQHIDAANKIQVKGEWIHSAEHAFGFGRDQPGR
jgi:hypothetical protein